MIKKQQKPSAMKLLPVCLFLFPLLFVVACDKRIPPKADFSFVYNKEKSFTINFENKSSGEIRYKWNFGDGNTSEEPSPEHTYTEGGRSYLVTLTVTGNGGTASAQKRVFMPNVGFEISNNNCVAPCNVVFNDFSYQVFQRRWELRDSANTLLSIRADTTAKSFNYSFSSPGTYSVTLTINDTDSTKAETLTKQINILAKPLKADFDIENNNCIAPCVVGFNDKSINAETWQWTFYQLDGANSSNSSLQNPTNSYPTPGSYQVRLIITGDAGADTATKVVTIFPKPVEAQFDIENNGCEEPCLILFHDKSVNPQKWEWNFGDSPSIDTTQNPSHRYSSNGVYQVKLKITGIHGNVDSLTRPVAIGTKNAVADFEIFNNNCTAPCTASLVNKSINASTYQWQIFNTGGNPITIPNPTSKDLLIPLDSPATYRIELISRGANGTSDTTTKYLMAKSPKSPIADFEVFYDGCVAGCTMQFTNKSLNASAYVWNYFTENGTTAINAMPVNTANATFSFTTEGRYRIELIASNIFGSADTLTKYVTVASAPDPVADFEVLNDGCVASCSMQFINKSSNALNYSWNYFVVGNNVPVNPVPLTTTDATFTFTTAGSYRIELTATNAGGTTNTIAKHVTVGTPAAPIAEFKVFNDQCTVSCTIQFVDESTNATGYTWTFYNAGGGVIRTSFNANESQSYSNAGTYRVDLEVTNASGATSTKTKYVTARAASAVTPVADFDINNGSCTAPCIVQFSDQSSNANLYSWIFYDIGGSVIKNLSSQNASHTYITAGIYRVDLQVTATNGNTDLMTKYVTINGLASLAVNLEAHYPFSGDANDITGNGNDGTLQGSPSLTTDRNGVGNNSYQFNGINQYITTNLTVATTSYSFSFWVKSNQGGGLASGNEVFLGTTDVIPNNVFFIGHFGNQIWVGLGDNSYTTNLNSFGTGWSHIVLTINGANASVYQDGQLLQTISWTGTISNSSVINIGRGGNDGAIPYYFNGNIDDLRVYDKVLSSAEIQALYASNN